jgi:hypothetical protein
VDEGDRSTECGDDEGAGGGDGDGGSGGGGAGGLIASVVMALVLSVTEAVETMAKVAMV